jgi:hypothetical protein
LTSRGGQKLRSALAVADWRAALTSDRGPHAAERAQRARLRPCRRPAPVEADHVRVASAQNAGTDLPHRLVGHAVEDWHSERSLHVFQHRQRTVAIAVAPAK